MFCIISHLFPQWTTTPCHLLCVGDGLALFMLQWLFIHSLTPWVCTVFRTIKILPWPHQGSNEPRPLSVLGMAGTAHILYTDSMGPVSFCHPVPRYHQTLVQSGTWRWGVSRTLHFCQSSSPSTTSSSSFRTSVPSEGLCTRARMLTQTHVKLWLILKLRTGSFF